GYFITRGMCQTDDAMLRLNYSTFVKHSIEKLLSAGLLAPKIKVIGQDILSNGADTCKSPSIYILFTTYVHTC
ncbi:DUF2310 family Zn-ribbon-containing protein, partial [Pseudoalteromonas undina]